MTKHKGAVSFWFLIVSLTLVACGPSDKTGNISGRLVFGGYDEKNPQGGPGDAHSLRLGIGNVMIVLGQVEKRLPKGPAVADRNEDNPELIGVLRENLTAVTDSNGRFTLNKVPVGTYLVLFHLLPDGLKSKVGKWDGVGVVEADVEVVSDIDAPIPNSRWAIPPSSKAFWARGGTISGKGNWTSQDGFTLIEGTVFSTQYGFCFSVRDERPYPIVKVQPDSTAETLITTWILPEQAKLGIQ